MNQEIIAERISEYKYQYEEKILKQSKINNKTLRWQFQKAHTGISEEKKKKNGSEKTAEEIMANNFTKFCERHKFTDLRSLSDTKQDKWHIIVNYLKPMKKKILKAASKKWCIAYRETIQIIMGFLSETVETRRQ